jgi:EAL domain-containing protein (putative c-di-GMP-specific phosphodiesterase class I)
MYKAKTSSTGITSTAAPTTPTTPPGCRRWRSCGRALTSDQLVLHYQPKIDLDTGEVHSVEALVRWDHPTRGLLYPDAFLSLVEESGLMPTMTRLCARWPWTRRRLAGQGRQLTVAVNLSASSLVDDRPARGGHRDARRPGSPAVGLQLEITEEFLMADRDRARSILTRLRDSGVQISVDDFGTGYSSLSYLRDLPIDELKLDRSFVFPMADDARAAALVASTIALAHSLGLRMVAEGVETERRLHRAEAPGLRPGPGLLHVQPVPGRSTRELAQPSARRSAIPRDATC